MSEPQTYYITVDTVDDLTAPPVFTGYFSGNRNDASRLAGGVWNGLALPANRGWRLRVFRDGWPEPIDTIGG